MMFLYRVSDQHTILVGLESLGYQLKVVVGDENLKKQLRNI